MQQDTEYLITRMVGNSADIRTPDQSIIGIYETMVQAEWAVRKLDEVGFPITQVSIVSQNLQSEREVVGYVTVRDMAQSGLITGAWTGGLLSLLAGVAFLWIPGFGPLIVAGRLAAVLFGVLSGVEGAVVGAAYGGVLGALAGWGISKEHILKYEEQVRAGKHLVIVHGSAEEVSRALSTLQDTENAFSHHWHGKAQN
jgi:Heat induced stress protein YflT domain